MGCIVRPMGRFAIVPQDEATQQMWRWDEYMYICI